jgi:histone deacetylase 6
MQILVGESSGFQFETAPSKEGLKTVLQVLKIQQQFWPVLGPTYASLQEQQGSVFSKSSE